jgi:hypothetical protein
MERSARRCAWQASQTLSRSKAGDHSNSTSRSVTPLIFHLPPATSKLFPQPDSIYTIQDALARISQTQSVQLSPSGQSKASQQVTVLIEALPPVLVLHLKRFLYDAATGGLVKIDKPVQFSPELEIPLGAISFSYPSYRRVQRLSSSLLGLSRPYGTRCRTTHSAGAIHALWSALPPRQVRTWRAPYGRRAPPERTWWHWRRLAAH